MASLQALFDDILQAGDCDLAIVSIHVGGGGGGAPYPPPFAIFFILTIYDT